MPRAAATRRCSGRKTRHFGCIRALPKDSRHGANAASRGQRGPTALGVPLQARLSVTAARLREVASIAAHSPARVRLGRERREGFRDAPPAAAQLARLRADSKAAARRSPCRGRPHPSGSAERLRPRGLHRAPSGRAPQGRRAPRGTARRSLSPSAARGDRGTLKRAAPSPNDPPPPPRPRSPEFRNSRQTCRRHGTAARLPPKERRTARRSAPGAAYEPPLLPGAFPRPRGARKERKPPQSGAANPRPRDGPRLALPLRAPLLAPGRGGQGKGAERAAPSRSAAVPRCWRRAAATSCASTPRSCRTSGRTREEVPSPLQKSGCRATSERAEGRKGGREERKGKARRRLASAQLSSARPAGAAALRSAGPGCRHAPRTRNAITSPPRSRTLLSRAGRRRAAATIRRLARERGCASAPPRPPRGVRPARAARPPRPSRRSGSGRAASRGAERPARGALLSRPLLCQLRAGAAARARQA